MVRQRPLRAHAPSYALAAAVAATCNAYDCDAIDRVVLEFGQISTASVHASQAIITLDVDPAAPTEPIKAACSDRAAQKRCASRQLPIGGRVNRAATLHMQVGHLTSQGTVFSALGNTYTDIDITCADLVVRQPQFGCNQGRLSAQGGPLRQIALSAAGAYNSASGAVSWHGSGFRVAGGSVRFDGSLQSGSWTFDIVASGLDLASARELAHPWLQLPTGDSLSGHVQLRLRSTGRLDPTHLPGKLQARLSASTSDLNYSNKEGTTVGQNVAAAADGTASHDNGRWVSDLQLRSSAGQILAGAALLDFAKNPLDLQAHLEPAAQRLAVSQLQIHQTDLIDAQAEGQIALRRPIAIERAHVDVQRLEFAAAYRSFLQLTLATTDFGALNVGGRAGGSLDITQGRISEVNAYLQNVSMADSTTRLSLANANGELHWTADPAATPKPSQLSWSSSSAYGLIGGPVEMGFTTRGTSFTLASNTRFPIFDGALVVHQLAIRRFGAPDTELDFDAHLEPISMPLLSKAFGWPILSGQLAGTIPGVTYRDHVLAMQGDLLANVFDGTILGSHLRLIDPWGPWPRLNADVTARHLDLDLVTHTFTIGSITGRMDADIKGLELFAWSPVAFDARLQTTPADRSRHLISQRAVTSISNVGGGGGGVAAALQSGILKFFDQFHYDRIGIRCQLRDEVCLMSGIEPARNGYYLVKGRGLPRIDIIGNAGRVDWTQLIGQISASMHSQNIVVR